MPSRKENSVSGFVRRAYPDLMEENFDQYNGMVSKLRSRAKARGFNPSDLTQEQFDLINNDNLPELEKGEKFHLSWENSSMCKGLIEEATEYLNRRLKDNNHVIEDGDLLDWIIIPSSVKLAARGIKYNDPFLLQASYLPDDLISKIKVFITDLQNKAAI